MPRLVKFLLIATLLLVGCEAGIIDAPTPTQETNYATPIPVYTGDCLPDGIIPLNPNPCPKDGLGYDMEFVSYPSANYESYAPVLDCDDKCIIGLHDPFGRAGFAGLQIHNVPLVADQLYILNLDGFLHAEDADEGNYDARGMIYTDEGKPYPLREQGVIQYVGGRGSRTGQRNFFWCIRPGRDMTVVLEAGVFGLWAEWHNGNHYEIDGMYIYPNDNINLCGETHIIQ